MPSARCACLISYCRVCSGGAAPDWVDDGKQRDGKQLAHFSNKEASTPSAFAILANTSTVGLRTPRSTPEM